MNLTVGDCYQEQNSISQGLLIHWFPSKMRKIFPMIIWTFIGKKKNLPEELKGDKEDTDEALMAENLPTKVNLRFTVDTDPLLVFEDMRLDSQALKMHKD